jgi:glutamate-1-semialdehyde 2,1-aminomutase
VPRAVKGLTHSFPFNDPDALGALLDRYPGEFAAVILEPVGRSMPLPGYLESVKRASRRHGALLIFDETVTGFRVHKGGAQALTGVIPDLATFGKGMANGFPLSAVVGPRRYMSAMEEIFFSATFGGEALSLAAAKSVLARVERDNVPEQLAACGRRLIDGLQSIIVDHRLGESFFVSGHPAWSFLNIRPSGDSDEYAMKTWLLQELFARGILFIGSHNLSAAHTDADIDGLLAAYGDLLPRCRDLALDRRLAEELRAEPLKPLFAVR